jgi:predicted hotdog family 3-hydroxylacyl-ACP dehydratase
VALSAGDFRELIPHRGAMSLLGEVLRCDDEGITCRATSHRDPDNPLREGGMLPAICGIEYAAQAMAVHGALCARRGSRPGLLAAVRDVALSVQRLDDLGCDLVLEARRLAGDARNQLYSFTVSAADRELVRGRAAVVLLEPDTR